MAHVALIMLAIFMAQPVTAANAETRKLKLYFLHTGEKAEITYKKNGRYVKSGLKKINRFLRDWRKNEPTKMNPRLLDLIWEVYQETGSRKHIHVISGYRSPSTNSLLRKRGRGVAKKSQHTLGNALDYFIPGVSLEKLRNIGLKKGLGGVGYYPRSGSPFVHMDTGRVRHWPRMNRRELVKVFPRGKTLHVPTDGKPLPGYNVAKARYERALKGKSKFTIASAEQIKKKPSILSKLFSREEDEESVAGIRRAPKPVKAKTIKTKAPVKVTEPKAPTPSVPVAKPELPTVAPTPEVQTPESVIAALQPSQIPIPVLAPRIAIAKSEDVVREETQVASLEPVQDAELINTDELTPVEEGAVFAVPIPSPAQRPEPATVLALAPTDNSAFKLRPAVEVSALSPNEISDLRKQVYETLETETAETTVTTSNTLPENSPFQPATELTKNDVPSLIQSASSAINQQIVSPIEPSLANTGALGIPTANPQGSSSLVTALLPEQSQTPIASSAVVDQPKYSVPVPQRAQRSQRQVAQIITPEPVQVIEPVSEQVEQTADKTIQKALTVKEFKSANLDSRLTGKWALATNASIKDIADINPPAYGQNTLVKTPSRVLSRGFSQESLGVGTSSFSGSSLEFLDFRNFNN